MKEKGIFIFTAVVLFGLFVRPAGADEGMWLLDQLDQLDLPSKGLGISTDQVWNERDQGLSGAVVGLGGCTASFVSPEGLIVTNHHCAYGAIQRNSTKERNLLEDGFLARTREEELPTFGTNVYVLQSFEDVTEQVLKGVKKRMTPAERQKRIEKNINRIVLKAEKEPGISARVASMNSGMWYVLYKSLRIKDVRLVYAPPLSIGAFGGDIDNFEWPRHTGDYSFLRAYVGPDGTPADPSEDNVPYRPKRWLRISTDGYRDGDFTMVIGFPGRTARYRTSADIRYREEFYLPWRLNMFEKYIALIEARQAEDPAVRIKLASLHARIMNSQKATQGTFDGFKRTNLYRKKLAQEEALTEFISSREDLEKYSHVLPEIKALYDDYVTFAPRRYLVHWLNLTSSVLSSAVRIVKWSEQKTKKEVDRESGYLDKDIQRIKQRWKYSFRNFDAELEKRALGLLFDLAHELPGGQKILTIDEIGDGLDGEARREAERRFIEEMYAGTRLTKLEERLRLLDLSARELEKMHDPAIQFASRLIEEMKPLDEKNREFDGRISELRPQFIRLLMEWKGGLMYPDANGTKRLSYGYVKGYSPRDAVDYLYYTTTDGILEKYTGKDPFDSPAALLEKIRAGDFGPYRDAVTDKMHVDFLTNLDTTGGNSGSPVLDARGRLIGLLFDGNYESIVADYIFDEPYTRSICVDIRYVLWLMERIDHADHLLREMGVK